MLADLLPGRGTGFCLAEPLTAPADQVLAVLAAHQLEGVVAKHLGSRWQPGRRSPHWRKHKLRRRHELRVAAWDPGDDHRPETLYLRDTRERPVGRVGLGHDEAERAALRTAIDERLLAARCSGRIRPLSPGLLVTVDAHGADGQPLRDPILRAWRADPDAPLSARQPPAVARRRPRSPQARL
jgi:ATP-dependent DNA ligase